MGAGAPTKEDKAKMRSFKLQPWAISFLEGKQKTRAIHEGLRALQRGQSREAIMPEQLTRVNAIAYVKKLLKREGLKPESDRASVYVTIPNAAGWDFERQCETTGTAFLTFSCDGPWLRVYGSTNFGQQERKRWAWLERIRITDCRKEPSRTRPHARP